MKIRLSHLMTAILASGFAIGSASVLANSSKPALRAPNNIMNFIKPASAQTWSGAYFGLDVGAGSGNATGTYSASESENRNTGNQYVNSIRSSSANLSGDAEGSMADIFVGYNFYIPSVPRMLLGIQLEGSFFSDITFDQDGPLRAYAVDSDAPSTLIAANSGASNSQSLTSMFSLNLRAGFLLNPSFLMYVIGGGTEGNMQSSSGIGAFFTANTSGQDGGQDSNTFAVFTGGKWVPGYNVGAGMEYRFNPNWSMRAEYRYTSFNTINDKSEALGNNNQDFDAISTTETLATDFSFNSGRIAVVYRFA